jgi:uncharacterized iron-regulated protein
VAGAPCAAQTQDVKPHGEARTSIEDGVDYAIFDRQGQRVSLADIIQASVSDDVLLVGEEHDDMIGHAFEIELLEAAYEVIGSGQGGGRTVLLSLEMFERDVQYVLDEYLAGLIPTRGPSTRSGTVRWSRRPRRMAVRWSPRTRPGVT